MNSTRENPAPRFGEHLTTISHEGRFWDVFVEVDEDPRHSEICRGLLAFSPAGGRGDEAAVRTGTILIEEGWEELLSRARQFDGRQLEALLRSALP